MQNLMFFLFVCFFSRFFKITIRHFSIIFNLASCDSELTYSYMCIIALVMWYLREGGIPVTVVFLWQ